MTSRRLAAVAALALLLAALACAIAAATQTFPRGVLALLAIVAALAVAWSGLTRRGLARVLGVGAGGVLAGAALVLMVSRAPLLLIGSVVALSLSLAAARAAFRIHVRLPSAPRPDRPVLFFNPRSGGGKSTRFHVADEARARGIEAIELVPGNDLAALARDAVAGGADALAVAGGDGSQAIVAGVAAESGLPYACIPAGTRNHFALDLGVDRDDVVGALDALVDGGERIVDLADVNGRIFVNNVSLGLYAEAVQQDRYRDAKIRTLVDTVPDAVGDGGDLGLRWRGPDGAEHRGGVSILVSNNRYRLGRAIGSGTRPRLDDGVLGVAAVSAPQRGGHRSLVAQWTTASLDVDADRAVPVGVDGEALVLEAPLRFRVHPRALRCRISRAHPGASPSAFEPDNVAGGVAALVGIALGRDPRAVPGAALAADGEAQPPERPVARSG